MTSEFLRAYQRIFIVIAASGKSCQEAMKIAEITLKLMALKIWIWSDFKLMT